MHVRREQTVLHTHTHTNACTWLPFQGDLVVHLAEAAREELDKPVRDISRPRLQSLLELAIRTSSTAQVSTAHECSSFMWTPCAHSLLLSFLSYALCCGYLYSWNATLMN